MKRAIQRLAAIVVFAAAAWAWAAWVSSLVRQRMHNPRDPFKWPRDYETDLVPATAYLFTTCWVMGAVQLLWLRPWHWAGVGRLAAALLAMWGGLMLLACHIVAAYQQLGSHAAVVEHTRRTAGVGWGVWVNYLFAAVWLADTVWLTAAPGRYARRPRWVGRAVHGFLAFVVLNATVVYGEPATRVGGAAWFAILGFSWWRRSWLVARSASKAEPPPR